VQILECVGKDARESTIILGTIERLAGSRGILGNKDGLSGSCHLQFIRSANALLRLIGEAARQRRTCSGGSRTTDAKPRQALDGKRSGKGFHFIKEAFVKLPVRDSPTKGGRRSASFAPAEQSLAP